MKEKQRESDALRGRGKRALQKQGDALASGQCWSWKVRTEISWLRPVQKSWATLTKQVQWNIKEGRTDEKVEAADTDSSFKDLLEREGRNGSVGGMDRQGFKFFSF